VLLAPTAQTSLQTSQQSQSLVHPASLNIASSPLFSPSNLFDVEFGDSIATTATPPGHLSAVPGRVSWKHCSPFHAILVELYPPISPLTRTAKIHPVHPITRPHPVCIPHHRTTAPPHHRTTAPPHHRTTAPPHHRITQSPPPRLSTCQFTSLLPAQVGKTHSTMRPAHLLRSLVTLVAIASGVVKGFSFNTSTPTQCGQWTVSWCVGVSSPLHSVTSGRHLLRIMLIAQGRRYRSFLPCPCPGEYHLISETRCATTPAPAPAPAPIPSTCTAADPRQTITVNSGRILNISIPTSVTAPYSYTFQLSEPSGLQFLATMYDSTGWGSGGTTDVLSE
jgi:hypothetical protein